MMQWGTRKHLSTSQESLVYDGVRPPAVVRREVDLQVSQERRGRLDEAVKVVPPAMAGQLVHRVAPQVLN